MKLVREISVILPVFAVLVFGQPASALADGPEAAANDQSAAGAMLAQATPAVEEINDPLESLNRVIFDFNEVVQDAILRPVTRFYNDTVPATVRQGVSNFINNLNTPVTLANDILQGEGQRALQTFGRALVNSTYGIFGFADLAGELGVERHREDFGQTLAVYGMGEGFYLVLPILGPSNPRDAIGKLVVDPYFDPLGLYLDNIDREEIALGISAFKGVEEYARIVEELDQVKKTSVDYYAAIRSLYRQKRKTEIHNGSILELPPIPDLGYDTVPDDFDRSLAGINQNQPLAR
ncbi:MAG: VacJ family lipoprotein [Rhodospirillales bacterium]|nr:VacJ family lipoprotein [Rhodospirillales bacterium]